MSQKPTIYNEGGPMVPASSLLPTDTFERTLAALLGHPDGAHTQPTVLQLTDFYGNTTEYIVRTVRWSDGDTVFVTVVTQSGAQRFILSPKVVNTIQRQRDAVALAVRRRHGRRQAAERKAAGYANPLLDPAVRAKAQAAPRKKRRTKKRRTTGGAK